MVAREAVAGSVLDLCLLAMSVVGCFAVAFVLLEPLGVRGTIQLAAAGNLLIAVAAWLLGSRAGTGASGDLDATGFDPSFAADAHGRCRPLRPPQIRSVDARPPAWNLDL